MANSDGTMTPYEYRKARHKCTVCGTKDAYTEMGRARCGSCAEKHLEAQKKYEKNESECQIERRNERRREKYAERLAAGVCTRCGKRPQWEGRTVCKNCNARRNRISKKHREKNGVISRDKAAELNLCFRCLKDERVEGYQLCRECYEWWIANRNSACYNRDFTKQYGDRGGGTNGEV